MNFFYPILVNKVINLVRILCLYYSLLPGRTLRPTVLEYSPLIKHLIHNIGLKFGEHRLDHYKIMFTLDLFTPPQPPYVTLCNLFVTHVWTPPPSQGVMLFWNGHIGAGEHRPAPVSRVGETCKHHASM